MNNDIAAKELLKVATLLVKAEETEEMQAKRLFQEYLDDAQSAEKRVDAAKKEYEKYPDNPNFIKSLSRALSSAIFNYKKVKEIALNGYGFESIKDHTIYLKYTEKLKESEPFAQEIAQLVTHPKPQQQRGRKKMDTSAVPDSNGKYKKMERMY